MNKYILILIVIIAFIFRFINYNYPPLLWDEASLGYNAYSIIKTGKDEYGQFLPYIFKSFGDYKPGLYVYLCLPFVAVFGLNPMSVRLPSMILGSFLPLLLYLLITKISPKSTKLALISSILLAFNPWNIHFSRGAWESNILLFEIVFASWLFIGKKYFISSLVFSLTLYTYQGGKLLTPLIILILSSQKFRSLLSRSVLFKFFLPLFLFSLPIIYGILFQNDSNRLQVFSLWSYHRPQSDISQILNESNVFDYQLFHSEPLFFLRNFLLRYFNHFSPRFLAFDGDWQIARHSAPYVGMILYPSFVLFVIGLIFSLNYLRHPLYRIFFLWLLIAPLPSALTRDIIQPVRALSLSVPIMFFTAVGINFILEKFKSRLLSLFLIIVYALTFAYYSEQYYNHMVKVNPDHWLYGYQQASSYLVAHGKDKQVTFTDFYGQPYIYYLFYSSYDPSRYQEQAKLITNGFDTGKVQKIDNITFQTPDFNYLKQYPSQLLIFSYDDALRQGIDLKILTPLSPINGHSSFYAYETN